MNKLTCLGIVSGLLLTSVASASSYTSTINGFDVTTVGASTVGGVVVNLIGSNNARVVSQLSASSLFVGFYDGGTPSSYNGNPGTIGIQSGFNSTITDMLGGGLSSASFRFSLFDGDTSSNDFDENDNTLLVNGVDLGNWTSVIAQETDGLGSVLSGGLSSGGFRDNTLDTGWFTLNDSGLLSNLFTTLLASQSLTFQVSDADPFDNFYDFTRGIDASLLNVGQGPVVTPPTNNVPEPTTLALAGLGFGLMGAARRRRSV